MLWLYDIKIHFILICDPHAKPESIIERLSPSHLPTVRAGKETVTSQLEVTHPNSSRIFYMFLVMQRNLPPEH